MNARIVGLSSLSCVVACAWLIGSIYGPATLGLVEYPDRPARNEPIHIEAYRAKLLEVPQPQWEEVMRRFRPRLLDDDSWATNPSLCIHSLRLHGLRANFDDPVLSNADQVIRALTTNDFGMQVFGAQLLARTRHGVRYRPVAVLPDHRTSADSSHVDQNLASLLELGLPLSTPIQVGSETWTLERVLADAVGNFNLREPELEWSVVALALSLPPVRSWRNRYGERFTFDDVVHRLASRSLDRLSCGGTHVMYSLVILANVQERHTVLTPEAAQRIDARLREFCGLISQNQRADGSWDRHWFRSKSDPVRRKQSRPTVSEKLLITGHLGECLLRLPEKYRLDNDVLRRAGTWVWSKLPAYLRTAPLRAEYCPLTHAALLVDHVRRD